MLNHIYVWVSMNGTLRQEFRQFFEVYPAPQDQSRYLIYNN